MFRAKTVLVLGAGASCEVGLPEGSDLLQTIVRLISFRFRHSSEPTEGDYTIYEALRGRLKGENGQENLQSHLRSAAEVVRSAAQAISIDNVIDMLENEKAELVGKLAISRAILEAERESTIFLPSQFYPNALDLENFSDTWYARLTKLLTEGVRKSSLDRIFDNLTIINFNYDRCLEHYLPFSISEYFGVTIEKSRALVDGLQIHRPYGRVGRLPWQTGFDQPIDFGSSGPNQISSAATQLRTFTEQVDEGDALYEMRETLVQADRIIFLGFAFHRQNVKLLAVDRDEMPEILATTYKVSSSDQNVIRAELVRAFGLGTDYDGSRVDLYNETCTGLFNECWRTFTAEKQD